MEGEAPTQASTPTGAVFLSYASQDSDAARRIRDALRAAGIDVWFDQSELRGGDAWDRQIRKQIHDCTLFVPIISTSTQVRFEGYFRLEWKLAVERTHLMSDRVAFLVPVVIDDTSDAQADVPERFRAVHWTRLPGGVTQPEFVARIKRLLSQEPSTTAKLAAGAAPCSSPIPQTTDRPSLLRRALLVAVAGLFLAALVYLLADKFWNARHGATAPPATTTEVTSSPRGATPGAATATAPFNPPAHSIAVLPFVNLSGEANQQYFSDGLTEELLNSLSRINELQVAARTSSFSFQGEHPDLATVARKLNVASVLEGSVRRSGHTIRVTAQLNSALTGFHLWSQTYDRDLGDVLKIQTDIANAVASALKVTLLSDIAAKIELGGTHNPAAFDAYLRASKAYNAAHDANDAQTAIAAYTEAIRLDPDYALAFAGRSQAFGKFALSFFAAGPALRDSLDRAQTDAQRAVALAPDLADGHLALAKSFERDLNFVRAKAELGRALALAPGNAGVLRYYGLFATLMGQADSGIAAARRAVALDPLNPNSHAALADSLRYARRYDEAIAAYEDAMVLDPDDPFLQSGRGFAYYALGNFESARTSCEFKPQSEPLRTCLAITYHKLGRHAEAEAMLEKKGASKGDVVAYGIARIYAQWGDSGKALEALETAMVQRSSWMELVKVDPFLDPLRNEPRFQAIERALKFPD